MRNVRKRSRGTTLVIALALLAALALIGATMISMARVDRFAAMAYKDTSQMQMWVEGALDYLSAAMTANYWQQYSNVDLSSPVSWSDYTPICDDPWAANSYIAVVRPDTTGKITAATDPTGPGLLWTSVGDPAQVSLNTLKVYNLPIAYPIPNPSTSNTGGDGRISTAAPSLNTEGQAFPQNFVWPIAGNRTLRISMTVLDLGSRLNVNFHGDGNGENNTREGATPQDVIPNWISADAAAKLRAPVAAVDLFATLVGSRWGGKTCGDQGDGTIKQFGAFNVQNAVPFTLEEGLELWNWTGSPFTSRIERALPSMRLDGGSGAGGSNLFRRSLFTSHSWVAAVRRNFWDPKRGAGETVYNEPPGELYVKADLNLAPLDSYPGAGTNTKVLKTGAGRAGLRQGIVATRGFDVDNLTFATANAERKKVDQIAANIIGFRDQSGQPTAIKSSDGTTVYGVTRQPFINEVCAKATSNHQYVISIMLANPYQLSLTSGKAYNQLTIGPGKTVVTLPASIPAAAPWTPGDAAGVVVTTTVTVGLEADGKTEKDLSTVLYPIELRATAQGDDTTANAVLIDRMQPLTPAPSTPHFVAGDSLQRFGSKGNSSNGTSRTFFGGYSTINQDWGKATNDILTRAPNVNTNVVPLGLNLNADNYALIRPIEHRGLNEGRAPATLNRYTATGLSFRRTGDIARILVIGPRYDPNNVAGAATLAVTEILGNPNTTEEACHVNLLSAAVPDYRRMLETFTVNSPFCDGVDNDDDGLIDDNATYKAIVTSAVDINDKLRTVGPPEVYEPGRINLKSAPPEVVRAMMPYQLSRHVNGAGRVGGADPMWTAAVEICKYSQGPHVPGVAPKVLRPADILDDTMIRNAFISTTTPTDRWDDDNNGAPDDYAQKTFLYGYMSNWATTRSDCYAVYGTVQITNNAVVNGAPGANLISARHFLAILDRVPATAYPPILRSRDASGIVTKANMNPRFIPMRRLFFTWLE